MSGLKMSPNQIQPSPNFSFFFFLIIRDIKSCLDQVYQIVGLYALPLKIIMIKFVQSQMGIYIDSYSDTENTVDSILVSKQENCKT